MKGLHAIRALWVQHRIFMVALLLGAAVRAVTVLAFRPALWFGGDSASYLAVALRLQPDVIRESGYGLLLFALRPLHSVIAVTVVQHLMGLCTGFALYLLLHRRFGLPAWGATLAAVPVLFDAYQIELEHEVLSDVFFEFLIIAALFTLIWWWRESGGWACVSAGVLIAIAAVVRPIGLPLLAVYLCYLLLRRVRWQVLGATAVAAALPIAGYAAWFNANHHMLNLTRSDGIFLWSRTMSFANCAVIKPPGDEAKICPPPGRRLASSSYIWVPQSPLANIPGPRFSARKNSLALRFALRAIAAQPTGYAAAVLHDFMLSFYWNRPQHPSSFTADKYQFAWAEHAWARPDLGTAGGGSLSGDQRAYTHTAVNATRAYEPYAGFMRGYQRFIYLRGTLLGMLLLVGLAAIVRSLRGGGIRRLRGWGGPALFPWLVAVGLLLVPAATADFDLRYVVPSVPAGCLAAALAFVRPGQSGAAMTAAGSAGGSADGSAGVLQASGHPAHREQQQPL